MTSDRADETTTPVAQARHTEGPWRIFRSTDGRVIIGIGELNGMGVTDAGFGTWRDGPEQEANARLIASVPELLEALQAFIVASDPACLVERDHPQAGYANALRLAYAAQAKATGADQ